MYRAVTLFAIQHQIDVHELSDAEIDEMVDQIQITFSYNRDKEISETYLNGENVEALIRGKEVSEMVSLVSQQSAIRRRMIDLQRRAGKNKGIVLDGRDIGTVVFPDAELKLFMTAKANIRAERRYQELKAKGQELDFEEILKNIEERDFNDTNRKEHPLRKAEDAIVLDNSTMNQEEQLDWVMNLFYNKINGDLKS
ncbi:MAG: (d)CMP kinase [Bacteroidetes bacterium]|nr:MAG: (d)CMP kinase [Bacteroidota bacterium]